MNHKSHLLVVLAAWCGILAISPASGLPLHCGPSVGGSAAVVGPDGAYYIGDSYDVYRVDPSTGARSIVIHTDFAMGLRDLTFDADGHIVAAGGTKLISINTLTGLRTVIPTTGFEPVSLSGLTIVEDGTIYFMDEGHRAIVRSNPDSGTAQIISSDTIGTGPGFLIPANIAVDSLGRLLVSDQGLFSILRVDPVSGDREIISGPGIGSGPALAFMFGLLVGTDDSMLAVSNHSDELLEIDPVTGNRSVVATLPSDVLLYRDILPGNGDYLDLLATRAGAAIIRVDLVTQTSGFLTGGSELNDIVDLDANTALTINLGLNAVLAIDKNNGATTTISDEQNGTGPLWSWPAVIALEPGGTLILIDSSLHTAFRVDLATGDRSILSAPGSQPGPDIPTPNALEVAEDGLIYTVTQGVYTIDPVTGEVAIVSDVNTGTGAPIAAYSDIAIDSDGTLLVTAASLSSVQRIDPVTGDRVVVSSNTVGDGPSLDGSRGIVVSDGLILVKGRGLYAVDPQTGDRTHLYQEISGGSISPHRDIALMENGNLIASGNSDFLAVFDPVTRTKQIIGDGDGDRISDHCDNCTSHWNQNQYDANNDGFGNVCDADLDDDCATNFKDLAVLRDVFFGNDSVADLTVDGQVNFDDLDVMRERFFAPPGPSASGCN